MICRTAAKRCTILMIAFSLCCKDDDLEEGEVKDPSDKKIRPRPICRFFIKGRL